MAFEHNPALNRLLSPGNMPMPGPSGMNPMAPRPSGPQMGYSAIPRNQSFWEKAGNFFLGSPEEMRYYSPYDSQQQGAFQQLLQMGLQNQQDPYAGFEPLQQSILDYYNQQVLPSITEQFTAGTGGALSSPGFGSQVAQSARGLAEQFLQHKMNYGDRNRQFGLQQAQMGLTPQYEASYLPRTPGALEDFWNANTNVGKQLLPAAAKVAAAYFGGMF